MTTPKRLDLNARAKTMKGRIEKCWSQDINWSLYPLRFRKGCEQLGKAFDMPPTAVFGGLLLLVSHRLSHSIVKVPNTNWVEPVLLWLTICMPTGSGKTPLFTFLNDIIKQVRVGHKLRENDPAWCLDEASFEMMGYLMAKNDNKLLGLYDEFSTFLAQINVYRGKGLCESHDLATLLSLYNAKSWNRDTVSGDANFHMSKTGLTLGGFTQPSVAANLVELPQSQEKGLAQRFLWISPKPCFAKFATLEQVNEEFCKYLIDRLITIRQDNTVITFKIPEDSDKFATIYDNLQSKISQISVTNELLAGMFSKAKGQILRVAACIHVLISDYEDHEMEEDFSPIPKAVPSTISEYAIIAAEDFVTTCCQHCAYLSGRSTIENEIKRCGEGNYEDDDVMCNAAFTILQPGKVLDLSLMLKNKKYQNRGQKDGAVIAMKRLEADGLGTLQKKDMQRGASAVYRFEKTPIPENLAELASKLAPYGISIREYQASLTEETSSSKRKAESDNGNPLKAPRSE